MGKILSKLSGNKDWDRMPWRHWKSPLEQARVMPTFVACEWYYRALAIATFLHAKKSGKLSLWFSAWMCGTFNDVFFMFMPFCDNFWQAQASVMLTPRLPLYIVEVYAVILYLSTTAARKFSLPYAQEAALTGLLAHVLYGVYDINGPRFLWWTWHDDDPAVSVRQANAPIGSSVWMLTYTAMHAFLYRWTNDAEARLAPFVSELALRIPQAGIRKLIDRLIDILVKFDGFHDALVKMPAILKIFFSGACCTPLFMINMGIAQIFSMDKVGIPGFRTYKLIIGAYMLTLAPFVGTLTAGASQSNKVPDDARLKAMITGFFAMHLAIGVFAKPETHVSTGCHQICSDRGEIAKDIMGWKRMEYVEPSGPSRFSKNDFEMASTNERDGACCDAAGNKIIPPNPGKGNLAREWYSIKGKKHADYMAENRVLLLMALVGTLSYRHALL